MAEQRRRDAMRVDAIEETTRRHLEIEERHREIQQRYKSHGMRCRTLRISFIQQQEFIICELSLIIIKVSDEHRLKMIKIS